MPPRVHELLERRAAERKGERVANGRADILELGARRRRSEDDVVRADVGDDDPGVRQERNARHVLRCAAAAESPSAMKIPPVANRRRRATAPPRRSRPASASASKA